MTNLEKYDNAFIEALEITETQLGDDLVFESTPIWDSVGHMTLIVTIEEAFNIMMDTDDIIDFSSYNKGKEIMKKYDIEL